MEIILQNPWPRSLPARWIVRYWKTRQRSLKIRFDEIMKVYGLRIPYGSYPGALRLLRCICNSHFHYIIMLHFIAFFVSYYIYPSCVLLFIIYFMCSGFCLVLYNRTFSWDGVSCNLGNFLFASDVFIVYFTCVIFYFV